MKYLTLFSLLALLMVTSCNKNDDDDGGSNSILGQTIEINFGESVMVNSDGIILSFTGIDDSRCPSDVICITAGEAKATFVLALTGGSTEDVVLTSPGLCFEQDGSCGETKNAGAYSFQLLSIDPYPITTAIPTANDYKVKMIIDEL